MPIPLRILRDRSSHRFSSHQPLTRKEQYAREIGKTRPQEKANPAGFRKVSFGAIAKQKRDSRNSYPLPPDPHGGYAAIAARILERSVQVEVLGGALQVDKAELKTLAKHQPPWLMSAFGLL